MCSSCSDCMCPLPITPRIPVDSRIAQLSVMRCRIHETSLLKFSVTEHGIGITLLMTAEFKAVNSKNLMMHLLFKFSVVTLSRQN